MGGLRKAPAATPFTRNMELAAFSGFVRPELVSSKQQSQKGHSQFSVIRSSVGEK